MSKSLDRLGLLQTFVRIAEAGSISAAARSLGLSQPSVSRQLAELESRFQTQLMQRTTHALSLTPAGTELLADARRLLDDWTVLKEKHLDDEETLRGTIKVVAPIALGQLHLIEIALQFQQQHPLVSLSWQLEDDEIRFAEVGCDCWIKIGPIQDKSLEIEPLCKVERMVVASPSLLEQVDAIKTPSALEKISFVALAPFEGGQIPLANQLRKVMITPFVRLSTNNILALKKATIAGLGASVMPRWFITDELEAGKLVDALPEWKAPELTIHLAVLPGRHRPRRLRSFVETIKKEVPSIAGMNALGR